MAARRLLVLLALVCFVNASCGTASDSAPTTGTSPANPQALGLVEGAEFWIAIEQLRSTYELGESVGVRASSGLAIAEARRKIMRWQANHAGIDPYADAVAYSAISFANAYETAGRTGTRRDLALAEVSLNEFNRTIHEWNLHVGR